MAQGIETTMGEQTSSLRTPIRGLHGWLYADPGPLTEAEVYPDEGAVLRDSDCLHTLPQDTRREDDTRGNVPSGFERDYTPSKFGVKLCQMWIDALKTDDEQWYLDGYNLYIDRVIFNPNI